MKAKFGFPEATVPFATTISEDLVGGVQSGVSPAKWKNAFASTVYLTGKSCCAGKVYCVPDALNLPKEKMPSGTIRE